MNKLELEDKAIEYANQAHETFDAELALDTAKAYIAGFLAGRDAAAGCFVKLKALNDPMIEVLEEEIKALGERSEYD